MATLPFNLQIGEIRLTERSSRLLQEVHRHLVAIRFGSERARERGPARLVGLH